MSGRRARELEAAAPALLIAIALVLAGCASGGQRRAAPPPAPAERAALPDTPATPAAPPAATPVAPFPADPEIAEDPGAAASGERLAAEDLRIRVGLASDLAVASFPCCEGRVALTVRGETVVLAAPFTVAPAAGAVTTAQHRLQVAAMADEAQAGALAASLSRKTGWAADARLDAGSGLYRVRLGRFPTRPAADAARRQVAELGFGGAWVVAEGGGIEAPALRLSTADGRSFRIAGRWLAVGPSPGLETLPVSGNERYGRYRGRLLLFLNARGTLNLINELPVESYLRGVVPRELGPEQYPRIEALKAQAVAARTYALRRLGAFAAEGFDICAEPRCQVYGGADAEHPLSDRAVAETAGQVLLFDGAMVEALYSATCGGHTEDAEVVFPWLQAPYLRGVPCLEGGEEALAGAAVDGERYPAALTLRWIAPPAAAAPREALEERLRALAAAAGLPPVRDSLRSLSRVEVRRYVRSVFDLLLDPALLAAPETASLAGSGGGEESAAWLVTRVADGEPSDDGAQVAGDETEWLLLELSRMLGLLREEPARFHHLASRELTVHGDRDGERRLALPADLVTLRRRGGVLEAAPLSLAAGDRLTLFWWRGRLAALAREAEIDPSPLGDRPSRLASWSRFRSDTRLASLVGERYPGLAFRGLEVVSRGVSGRVGALKVLGAGGRSETVQGLAVRWTLDLPDTRFSAQRIASRGGEPGWLFTGGGWGHGVGMCQVGAYAMAGRGLDYRAILAHYYTGVTLGRVVSGGGKGS